FDAATGKELRHIMSIPEFSHALIAPDCKRVITSHEKYIGVRDIQTVECVHVLSMENLPAEQFPRIVLSPDGKSLLSWVSTGPIREWELTTGKQTRVLLPHNKDEEIRGVSFLPDGSAVRVQFCERHVLLESRTGRPATMPEWLASFHNS